MFAALGKFCKNHSHTRIKELHVINKNTSVTPILANIFKEQLRGTGFDKQRPSTSHSKSMRDDGKSLQSFKSEKGASRSERPFSGSTRSRDDKHKHKFEDENDSRLHSNKRSISGSQSSKYNGKGARPKVFNNVPTGRRSATHKTSTVVRSVADHRNEQSVDDILASASVSVSTKDEDNPPTLPVVKAKGNLAIINNGDNGDQSPDDDDYVPDMTQQNHCDICMQVEQRENLVQIPCRHLACMNCVSRMSECILCSSKHAQTVNHSDEVEKSPCVICMDDIDDGKRLTCGHEFHHDCIKSAFSHKPVCPVCGTVYGNLKGNQPADGRMKHFVDEKSSLKGFEGCGTIVIEYNFPDGRQGVILHLLTFLRLLLSFLLNKAYDESFCLSCHRVKTLINW